MNYKRQFKNLENTIGQMQILLSPWSKVIAAQFFVRSDASADQWSMHLPIRSRGDVCTQRLKRRISR